MNKRKFTINLLLLALLLISYSATSSLIKKESGEKIVYVDGIYDLAHYGHAKSFNKARNYAAAHFGIPQEKIKLLVGICDDGNLKAYKREPIYSLEQRVEQVKSFKGVDVVLPHAPMAITRDFIIQEGIDLVMHGDDFNEEKIKKYYSPAIDLDIFATYPYEPGVSTTAIIKRAAVNTLQTMLDDPKVCCEDREAIERVLKLLQS